MAEELSIKEPQYTFYQVTVEIEMDTEKGGTKKVKETHLVDAVNPTEVEKKVAEVMDGTMYDWRISSMTISKIGVVY
jgi:hypothetical protein